MTLPIRSPLTPVAPFAPPPPELTSRPEYQALAVAVSDYLNAVELTGDEMATVLTWAFHTAPLADCCPHCREPQWPTWRDHDGRYEYACPQPGHGRWPCWWGDFMANEVPDP